MALIREGDRNFKRFLPVDEEEAVKSGPGVFDVIQSTFAQENTFVNFAANGFSLGDEYAPVEGYNPFEKDIEGYEIYSESFIESRSPEETYAIKNKISEETRRIEIMRNGGATTIAATIAAGVTDPIYWPLMLIGVGQARTAQSTARAFSAAASAAVVAEVPVEAVKHKLQETRTIEESAINIGGAALLSGLLGSGVHKLAKKYPEAGVVPNKLIKEIEDEFNSVDDGLSIGAARVKTLTDDDLRLKGVFGLEKVPVSPLIRLATSPSTEVKAIASQMLETPLVSEGNIIGKATAPEGGSVETRIKMWDANLAESIQSVNTHYASYRKSRKGDKSLSSKNFRIEIGKAMRRGDESAIPEVSAAAKEIRRSLFDPLKDAAIKAKLLPKDVEVTTATSYLTRVYDHKKIIGLRPEWNSIVDGWLKGIRKSSQDKVDKILEEGGKVSQSLKGEAGVSDLEIEVIRNHITDRILGNNSGRAPYDITLGERGPLKERTFQIPDKLIEQFLESDIDDIAHIYKNTMAPDVELGRMYGDVTMAAEIESINNSYSIKSNSAKTEKERLNLDKRQKSDVRDVEAMRDRLRGTFGAPKNPDDFFVKTGRRLRDLNFMSLLGGMTLSAIPDAARLVAVNGLRSSAKGLRNLAISPKRFKIARNEAKKAAVGLDMVLNSRAASLADITDSAQRGSPIDKGLRQASNAFSKLALMTQWNAALKQFSGVITSDRIIEESLRWASGKIKPNMIRRLAASGIDEDMAVRISKQFEKYGDDGDLKLINGDSWDDIPALETFRAAVLKDVDRTIVTPGVGEKPLWTSTEMGKTIFQFKTFAASSHHKIFLAGLQHVDAMALNGFLLSVALGTLSYGMKQYVSGREISDNPNQVTIESLDRSGAFGYLWDVNNISSKMTNGKVSVENIFGADPVSRYASRNIIGAMFGPSIGKIEDARTIVGNLSSEGELSEADIGRVRRMLPGQNLFYMRQLLDKLEGREQ